MTDLYFFISLVVLGLFAAIGAGFEAGCYYTERKLGGEPPWHPDWMHPNQPPPAPAEPSIIIRAWEERGRHYYSGSHLSQRLLLLAAAPEAGVTVPEDPAEIKAAIQRIITNPE